MPAKSKGVRATHPDYDNMVDQWTKCRDLEQGQRAVHAARERYLPKLKGEDEVTDYPARVARSDYFNGYFRTINGLVGMAFRKDPETDLPAAIEAFADNIDMAGMTLSGMAKDACEDVLQYGRVFLMADHPPMPENVSAISQAVAEQLGMRPALAMYDALAVINWRYANVGNAKVLVRVVLKEQAWIDKDEWEQVAEDRYRVLDLDDGGRYRQRVYRINDKGEDELVSMVYPVMSGMALTFIPGVFIDPNGMGGKVDEPPLIDLADKNIAHYQVNSDYRHGAHFTALPTLFLAGITEETTILIGGSAAITAQDPNARGEFIEYKGTGLGALEKQLDRIEHQMAVLGAQMIVEQAVTKTATEAAINQSGENSVMASLVMAVSDAFTWALRIMAAWAGATGEVRFEISREFNPLGLSPQQLTAYMSAVQQGLMSEREFYALAQRGDVIDAAKPFEEHQEELTWDGPTQPAITDMTKAAA